MRKQRVPETELTLESTLQNKVKVHDAQLKIIEVAVHVDLRDGYMMKVMALIDISFMRQEFLEKLAPHLLQNTNKWSYYKIYE